MWLTQAKKIMMLAMPTDHTEKRPRHRGESVARPAKLAASEEVTRFSCGEIPPVTTGEMGLKHVREHVAGALVEVVVARARRVIR